MRVIAVANQKGGVGKTTCVLNLGAGMSRMGKRVLLIDLDPQANLTEGLGVEPEELERTIFDLMDGRASFEDVVIKAGGVDLVPSNISMSGADIEFSGRLSRETMLWHALKGVSGYDYIFLDCPPNLGLITVNAFVAAREIFIPLQTEFYSLSGLRLIQMTYELVRERLNSDLRISGIIGTLYDKRKVLNREVVRSIQRDFGDIFFSTLIRDNVSLAEAPSHGQNIFTYKPDSFGAEDFTSLCQEIMQRS